MQCAARLGADAVGFVCVPGSKRQVSLAQAAKLRSELPPMIASVLLLSNPTEALAREAVEVVRPDYVQFHGAESAEFCAAIGHPYFKAVSVGALEDVLAAAENYPAAAALLLDSHGADGMGGTGHSFDWTQIPRDLSVPLILAGGLNPENVGRAVRMAPLYAVDVSSGIEEAPGIKDPRKMRAFVRAVQAADARRAR